MAKVPTSGERELRAQGRRTMGKLLEAGMTVLGEKGYHAARVDDIVKAAEVSHGTFYLYFANKQDLLGALAAQCAAEMTGVVADLQPVAPGPEGREAVRAWLVVFIESYRRYGLVIRAWMEGTVSDPDLAELGRETFGAVAATLVDRLDEGDSRQLGDRQLAAAALLALIERYTYFISSRGTAAADAVVLDTLSLLIHRGWFGGSVGSPPAPAVG